MSSPKPSDITTGIKGAVKRTILESMVKNVPGTFKVLIADTLGSQILNACMRMHDLMDYGVSLIENLGMARQPLPPSSAIYFIAPTSENVQRVVNDWATKDMYKDAHIYFISQSSDEIFNTIKVSRLGRSGKIKACVDLLISFSAPETLFFSLDNSAAEDSKSAAGAASSGGAGNPNDLKFFFGPSASSSDLGTAYQKKMAKTLAQVIHTLGDDPVIRHQSSGVAKRFSEQFYAEYRDLIKNMAASDKKAHEEHIKNAKPALLLIVDRAVDLAAPLLHDYHYQSMVMECAPLKNGNVYEYRPELNDPAKKDVVRECVLDEMDPYWCKYRHLHFAHASSVNVDDHNALHDKQSEMANQKKSGDAALSVHMLSAQIRQLPELLEQQRKIGLHRSLVVLLTPFYNFEVTCAEQAILESIADKKGSAFKDVMKKLMKLRTTGAGDSGFRSETKDLLRLGLLLGLVFPSDMAADRDALMNLAIAQEAPPALRGLSTMLAFVGGDPSARTFGQVKQTLFKTLAEKLRSPPPVYQYYLKSVMEQCVLGTLPANQFPFLKPADESKLNPSNFSSGAAAQSVATKSLRSKLTGGSSASAGGAPSGKSIDLGHGELVPLLTGPRVIVFVVGGATRGEMRQAYEVVRGKKREVLLGATSVTSANGFIAQLAQL